MFQLLQFVFSYIVFILYRILFMLFIEMAETLDFMRFSGINNNINKLFITRFVWDVACEVDKILKICYYVIVDNS